MVFASHAFLVFLVVVICLYWAVTGRLTRTGKPVLIAASLFFYGSWIPGYLLLLLASICFNYTVSTYIRDQVGTRRAAWATAFGVTSNVLLLTYYKYFMFLIESINWIGSTQLPIPDIILPIGISFFTFHQIIFLMEEYRGREGRVAFWDYLLYVTFFPQLIAGPISTPHEMLPQFARKKDWRLRSVHIGLGMAVFSLGLFKKAVIIDPQTPYIDVIYERAANGHQIGMLDGWTAALGYSFQIYFDFSAYSDMAIGLALIFGIRLPFNFFSPYKATGFRDFWRRWHITLSRFLREYLYIPFGGSRHGMARTILALMATMGIGGLWHGAGWQFLIWGLLHGAFLSINHLWSAWRKRHGPILPQGPWARRLTKGACICLTFVLVTMCWVYFRAPDVHSANLILAGMLGMSDGRSITELHSGLPPLLPLYLALVWLCPNTLEIMRRFPVTLHRRQFFDPAKPLFLDRMAAMRLSPLWAVRMAIVFAAAWFSLSSLSPFIYFQF